MYIGDIKTSVCTMTASDGTTALCHCYVSRWTERCDPSSCEAVVVVCVHLSKKLYIVDSCANLDGSCRICYVVSASCGSCTHARYVVLSLLQCQRVVMGDGDECLHDNFGCVCISSYSIVLAFRSLSVHV